MRPSARLAGIDGLRALAAFWVVLFHVHAFSGYRVPIGFLETFLRSGSTGVSLFLVLSGFCLYIPFAAGRQDRFRTLGFFGRRVRRLMPAYYASLVVVLAAALAVPAWLGIRSLGPPAAAWQLLTHATLVHTLFPSTFYALNGAYWSLGLEWQLYLGLPLLILAIGRFGFLWTLAGVVACNITYRVVLAVAASHAQLDPGSLLATAVLPNQLPGRWAEFGFGMAAAEVHARDRIGVSRWALGAAAIALALLALKLVGNPIDHILFGLVFMLGVLLVLKRDNLLARICEWPPLVTLGVMSYSLYLVHQPMVQALAYVAGTRTHSPAATFALVMAALPLVLLAAWALFILVERRTVSSKAIDDSAIQWVIHPERLRRRPAREPAAHLAATEAE